MGNQHGKHNDTARTLGWKVILQAAQNAKTNGQNDVAELLFDRVLQIVEKRFVPSDLRIGYVLLEMSDFYFSIGQSSAGELHLHRARSIMQVHANQIRTED